MLSSFSLRKTGAGWEFESEAALEDFVWANLEQLLRLTPLKRQYSVNGQVCDILALGENKQLVVLELKNTEDRYIVQQLTRYYDALIEEKPFGDEVDYKQLVSLVAIAPSFHRDNWTDIKYHTLSFQFLQFEIFEEGEKLNLHLKSPDFRKLAKIEITYTKKDNEFDIPVPPRVLLNMLSNFPEQDSQALMNIREKILSFDKRIQEITASGLVTYGKGKSKPCAQFCVKKDSYGGKSLFRPILVLWLPTSPDQENCKRVGRMLISNYSFPKHSFLSKMDEYSYIEYRPKSSRTLSANRSWYVKNYVHLYLTKNSQEPLDEKNLDYLDFLVNLALLEWQIRL